MSGIHGFEGKEYVRGKDGPWALTDPAAWPADPVTYLKTFRGKIAVWGIKPKVMKCIILLTQFHDQLTYLKALRVKVDMWGIKQKVMQCTSALTQFHDPLTYLKALMAKEDMWSIKQKVMKRRLGGPSYMTHWPT